MPRSVSRPSCGVIGLTLRVGTSLAVGLAIAACGSTPDVATSPAPAPDSAPAASPLPTPPAASEAIATASVAPGQYCYQAITDTLDAALRLEIGESQQITGASRATIANAEVGYYTSYHQAIAGQLTANQADVEVQTWIEYDVQTQRETWTVTPTTVTAGGNNGETYTAIDCAAIAPRFANADGIEAADLTADATAVQRQTVQFGPGTSGTTIENAVIRGERQVYVLSAQGGQEMAIAIQSLEDNASFSVVSPSEEILTLDAQQDQVILPHTGDYEVIVGSTRGNATYTLTISIP